MGDGRRTVAGWIGRRGAVVAAAILIGASVVAASPASAQPALQVAEGGNGTYLALGDSVAFGYVPSQATPSPNYYDASSFTSYANDVASALGLSLTNASCPGETTGSMISVTAISNGCENTLGASGGYRTAFPLHVSYTGSQLAYAVSYLKAHPHTRLVTIDIGANDAFVCEATTKYACTSSSELQTVLQSIATNLATIYHAIRVDAGYTHALVALDYYSLDYNSPMQNELSTLLNDAITVPTLAAGGIVADGFGAFQAASVPSGNPCTAGLLIPVSTGGCNIHPTLLGHQVLAQAILSALAAAHGADGLGYGRVLAAAH